MHPLGAISFPEKPLFVTFGRLFEFDNLTKTVERVSERIGGYRLLTSAHRRAEPCVSITFVGPEVVAVDDGARSDFDAMRTAVALRGRGLVFVAFDLIFLNGRDLRALPIEERRAELRRLIPRSAKSRLQFSEAIAGAGADVFASAEQLGLEGIVSKRIGSHYRNGRVDTWRKVKCWAETALILIGTDVDKRSGAPVALLARRGEEGCSSLAEHSSPSKTLSGVPYAVGLTV